MKILWFNRNHALWIGGDANQAEQTMAQLRHLGYEIDYDHRLDCDLDPYDLVHIVHITYDWGFNMAKRCMREGRKFVISAIYYPSGNPEIADVINASERTICLSENERLEILKDHPRTDPEKLVVIPNGIDKRKFPRIYDGKGSGVVWVGQVIPNKGCLELARVCKDLGLLYYHYGAAPDPAYLKQCTDLGMQHIPYVPQEKLAEKLSWNKIFVCPSKSERQSLSVIEAASVGLPIVDSIHNRGRDLLPSSTIVDPDDHEALKAAVKMVYEKGGINSDHVPTWSEVAEMISPIYEEAMRDYRPTLTDTQRSELNWWRGHISDLGVNGFLDRREWGLRWHLDEFRGKEKIEGRVLDLGCGPISYLRPYENIDLVAIDPLAKHFQDLLRELGFPKICYYRLEYGDGEQITMLEDESVDNVVCWNVIDHTPNPNKMAAEIWRVLKPGGRLNLHVNFEKELTDCHLSLWNKDVVHKTFASMEIEFENVVSEDNLDRYYGVLRKKPD